MPISGSTRVGTRPLCLGRRLFFDIDETIQTLLDEGTIRRVKLSATRQLLIHYQRFSEFCARILKTLERMHLEHPLRFRHPRTALEHQFDYLDSKEMLTAAIEQLKQDKKIDVSRDSIGLVGYGPKLSKGERQLLEQMTTTLRKAGVKPPSVKELQQLATKNRQSVQDLLQMAADNGELVAGHQGNLLSPTGHGRGQTDPGYRAAAERWFDRQRYSTIT